jgi:hypothetical protein
MMEGIEILKNLRKQMMEGIEIPISTENSVVLRNIILELLILATTTLQTS